MIPLAEVSPANGLGPGSTAIEGTAGGRRPRLRVPAVDRARRVDRAAARDERRRDRRHRRGALAPPGRLQLRARRAARAHRPDALLRVGAGPNTRNELRALRQRVSETSDADADTGLPGRGALPRPARARVEARPPRNGRDDGGLFPGRGRRRAGRLAARRAGAQGRRRGARRRGPQHRPGRPHRPDGPGRGDDRLHGRGRGRGARPALHRKLAPGHPRPPGRGAASATVRSPSAARPRRPPRSSSPSARCASGPSPPPTGATHERRPRARVRDRIVRRRTGGDPAVLGPGLLGIPQRRDRRARLRRSSTPSARPSPTAGVSASRRSRCCSRTARSATSSSPARSPSATACRSSTWPSFPSTTGPGAWSAPRWRAATAPPRSPSTPTAR